MAEMFEDICFRFQLGENDNGEELLLKWGVMQTPHEWVIAYDGQMDRYSYRAVATDLDLILKSLREEPSLDGLHFQLMQGSAIHFKPNRAQQFVFKMKFCGEELMDE